MNHAFLYEIINMLLIIIEGVMGILLAGGFFSKKYKYFAWLICIAILLITWWLIIYFLGDMLTAKIVMLIAAFSVWVKAAYKTSMMKSFFIAVFLLAYFYTVDIVAVLLFEILAGARINLYASPDAFYLFSYCTKIISLFGIIIIRTWAKIKFHNQAATWSDWLRTLFFPVSSLVLVISLIHIYFLTPSLAYDVLICSVILLIANMMSVLLLNHLEYQQAAIRDNIILQQNIKLERDNISAWMEAYSGQRQQTHDFQNQLLAVRGIVEESSGGKKAVAYIDRLLKFELPTSLFVSTNRTVVDVILNQKYAIAKSKQITFDTRLDDLSSFALPDDALVIVLSNLIDNAIEACEKINIPSERAILLKMQVRPEKSILYIENSTNEPVNIHNNRVVTTKSSPVLHGYGLQNVAKMLERYDAEYAVDYNVKVRKFCFSSQIMSPMQDL